MTPSLIETVAMAIIDAEMPMRLASHAISMEDAIDLARAALQAIEASGYAVLPVREGANVITGHSPLDLSDIDPVGAGAVYIDGLTLDEAAALLAARPRVEG